MTDSNIPFSSRASMHSFNFFRAGGSVQVRIETGADLLNLKHLDKKLWVALACPTQGLQVDKRMLELVDADNDGRIRAPDVLATVAWVTERLKNAGDLLRGSSELELESIADSTEEGIRLRHSAKVLLATLNKANATSLSVQDVTDASKAFNQQPFNGDGVITSASAAGSNVQQTLLDIIETVGSSIDRSGQPGVTKELVENFFKQIGAYCAWLAEGQSDQSLLPLGDKTSRSFEAFTAIRSKIDDYFARCRLAQFDARALGPLNRDEKDYVTLSSTELKAEADDVKGFPLARVDARARLSLVSGVNPAWATKIDAFRTHVVVDVYGEVSELTEEAWLQLSRQFLAYEAYLARKPQTSISTLSESRIWAIGQSGDLCQFDALFAREKEQEPAATSLLSIEKLVRMNQSLVRLLNNFVAFRDFYERKSPAVFQAGTLYLDQRACDLCLRVEDAAKHALVAPLAQAFLAYCDCVRSATGEKMGIVAAFTAGDSDNLSVGRNGIFFDRDGKDWDATITRIVNHPISIGQAFWSPYKKLAKFVADQISKRALAKETASHELLTSSALEAEKAAHGPKPAAAAPATPAKFDVGVIAALGVAVGGLSAAFGALVQSFFGLGVWMPLGVVGIVLLISGPSMFLAWLKLRQRNIGPLLDANGWAINSSAKLNRPLGKSLTKIASVPSGSQVDAFDPFAEKKYPWKLYAAIAVTLAMGLTWYLGYFDRLLPRAARSTTVLGDDAPAAADRKGRLFDLRP